MSLPVIPAVQTAGPGEGGFPLSGAGPLVVTDPALAPVVAVFLDDLHADTGLRLDVVVDATIDATAVRTTAATADRAIAGVPQITVELAVDGLDAVATAAGLRADGRRDADERHGIDITPDHVRVWAAQPEGVHRALTTLRQLIGAAVSESADHLPSVRVVDGPRFAWRGLSLDVVRTFHDVETVRRVIDMCTLHKLNVLHLHLTDNEGWRFEVPGRPLLTEVGAAGAAWGRPGGWYTPAQIAELVAYAARRFVTVVPEVDLPGHTGAVLHAYPTLAPEILASSGDGGFGLPVAFLDPARDETWDFVGDVLDAVIAQFPGTAFVHVGGDEAFGMPDDAHAVFVDRARAMVVERGRRPIGWQEAARGGVGDGDVVQYWMEGDLDGDHLPDALAAMVPEDLWPMILANMERAAGDVPAALAKGAQVLVSPTGPLYFDRPHAAASTDPAQESARARLGLPVYPATSLRDGVEWDPVEIVPGAADEGVLAGVEAAVWCETVTGREDLETLLLPRLAGAAERAWARGTTRWDDYARRLTRQTPTWDRRGWAWFRSSELDLPTRTQA
ncbi:beta-N-acetylhexosaminidase [Actinotalea sp. M2MS4P-6]|uniref:beta-N-acetylhexosaminidase n=1 Tax=Actinotalea sp. M2MS4P-6 TaxID=2983762 RepID=UPI0021E4D646|nr:beta-N-acetylhexosaminidase [Actinotalea sp. M2MS4P-6]MCV2394864.1 beta-N-acetylhexosaminidase [Actinotalea sp. M2MS4P-6]